MRWLNLPSGWVESDRTWEVTAAGKTDLRWKTDDGFMRDNGHFYHQPVVGDFVLEVVVDEAYMVLL